MEGLKKSYIQTKQNLEEAQDNLNKIREKVSDALCEKAFSEWSIKHELKHLCSLEPNHNNGIDGVMEVTTLGKRIPFTWVTSSPIRDGQLEFRVDGYYIIIPCLWSDTITPDKRYPQQVEVFKLYPEAKRAISEHNDLFAIRKRIRYNPDEFL